jgi:hypothetical protein
LFLRCQLTPTCSNMRVSNPATPEDPHTEAHDGIGKLIDHSERTAASVTLLGLGPLNKCRSAAGNRRRIRAALGGSPIRERVQCSKIQSLLVNAASVCKFPCQIDAKQLGRRAVESSTVSAIREQSPVLTAATTSPFLTEDGPGDPGELVGERDGEHGEMQSPLRG